MSRSLDILLLVLGVLYSLYLFHRKKSRYHLPPGPRRYPIIGSLLSIPIVHQHEALAELSKKYDSDILYFDAAGTPIVVLNSLTAATELLERRSANYSDRPYRTMVSELLGGQQFFSLKPYGLQWKEERKLLVRHLASQQNTQWNRRWLLKFSRRLIMDIMESPSNFMDHLGKLDDTDDTWFLFSILWSAAPPHPTYVGLPSQIRSGLGESLITFIYGVELQRPDPLVKIADETMAYIKISTLPGRFLVDQLPWLKYVPEFLPGAGFQRFAREGREIFRKHFEDPFEIAMKSIADGVTKPSFVSTYFAKRNQGEETYSQHELHTIQNTAGMIFAGAADTTNVLISNFIVAMLLHPHVQRKLHEEIDSLVEAGNIPTWGNRSAAPYLHAAIKEVLRWQPPAPTGIPHLATSADIYEDYYIPEGAVIFGNAWPILNDEEVFPNPRKFIPERFLKDGKIRGDILDPEIIGTFGFGRRRCPGAQTALSTAWAALFLLFATFEITNPKDENGNEVEPEVKYDPIATIPHVEPFRCTFNMRSTKPLSLIEQELESGDLD